MLKHSQQICKWIIITFFVVTIFGCTSNIHPPTHPQDPYEHFNRKIFAFNMALDHAFLRPIAKTYDNILPWPVKTGIRNFFSNIGDINSGANKILQLHFHQAAVNFARVVINTIAGVGGLFDVASSLDLEKNKEDFGLTLARWGSRDSPYLVIPLIGPRTLRDFVAMPIDYFFLSIWPYIELDALEYDLLGLFTLDSRATLLHGDKVIDEAFDPYIFVRDVYLQRRAYIIEESEEKHAIKYVDEKGVYHRRHRPIPTDSILNIRPL